MKSFAEAIEFAALQLALWDYQSRKYGWVHQPKADFDTVDLIAHLYDRPIANVRELIESEARNTYDRIMAANHVKERGF